MFENWDKFEKMAQVMVQSGFCADAKDLNQAMFKIMYGMELGVGPVAAMQGIFIMKQGVTAKPALSANLMATLIKQSGKYDYDIIRLDNDACEIQLYQSGKSKGEPFVFTIEDAKKAGLLSGPNQHNWARYSRNMMFARNISNVFRMGCGDLTGGAPAYVPEELDMIVDEDGNPVAQTSLSINQTSNQDLIDEDKLPFGKLKEATHWFRANVFSDQGEHHAAVTWEPTADWQHVVDVEMQAELSDIWIDLVVLCSKAIGFEPTDVITEQVITAAICDNCETYRRQTAAAELKAKKNGGPQAPPVEAKKPVASARKTTPAPASVPAKPAVTEQAGAGAPNVQKPVENALAENPEVSQKLIELLNHIEVQSLEREKPAVDQEGTMLKALAVANGWVDVCRGEVMLKTFGIGRATMATAFTWEAVENMAKFFATTPQPEGLLEEIEARRLAKV